MSAEALGLVGARQPLLLQQTWGQMGGACEKVLMEEEDEEEVEEVALYCCSTVAQYCCTTTVLYSCSTLAL